MDAYTLSAPFRASEDTIRHHIAERLNTAAVAGFAKLKSNGGFTGEKRLVSYFESSYEHWFLPLSAKKPMVFETDVVPDTSLPKVGFLLAMGFGNGSPLPRPTGQFDIYVNDHFALSCRVATHSIVWRGEECELAFSAHRVEAAVQGSLALSADLSQEAFATFGPGLLSVPTEWLTPGQAATIRIEAKAPFPSTRWIQIASGQGIFWNSNIYRLLDVAAGYRPTSSGKKVYFGDIHTHSGETPDGRIDRGCGRESREDNYRYAQGPAALDFYCLTDHEAQVDENKIEEFFALAEKYDTPGSFACLRGFEFTSLIFGHRCVYFRDTGGTIANACKRWNEMTFHADTAVHPDEMYRILEATGARFLTVPHHPSAASHPFNWDLYNPKYDRLAEVYSTWGSSEYFGDFPQGATDRYRGLGVRDALDRGYRMGMIASSDGHDGHPGNAQSPEIKHHHVFHHLGSGRAAVLCDELTRTNVFDALWDRRCYGTTGVPIGLEFEVNGSVMGSELAAISTGRPVLTIGVEGCNRLDHIRIVKNGRVVHTHPCHNEWDMQLEWADDAYDPAQPSYYYVRAVQADMQSAWSSPIWVG
jgi:hypothetical protein